jgi:hypothetical protein
MSPGAQNTKKRPDVLGNGPNEYGSVKYENWTSRSRYRTKRLRERKRCKWVPTPSVASKSNPGLQNMKTGPDALGSAQKEFKSAKYENGT